MKLNIGCGWDKKKGFINIDKAKEVKPDIVCDIEDGLPFKDNTAEYIYSAHCLEHVRPERWRYVWEEIGRVAKDGCILELKLPFDNPSKRCHIDHYRTFWWDSFEQYYTKEKLRAYYSNFKLEPLHKEPNKITKLFYLLFPWLKGTIYFKFRIHKKLDR